MTAPPVPGTPVPQEVGTELQRVVERWGQLPLDRALSHVPRVRALVQSLADRVAAAGGVASSVVPDLGPATLMDQLTVMVHEASVAATATGATSVAGASPADPSAVGASTVGATTLVADLARLRRELA